MDEVFLDVCGGFCFQAYGDASDCDVMSSVGAALDEVCSDTSEVQCSFKGEFKSIFAQSLAAKCVVDSERVGQRVQDRLGNPV